VALEIWIVLGKVVCSIRAAVLTEDETHRQASVSQIDKKNGPCTRQGKHEMVLLRVG
jgi:hypothetical protein